MTFGVKNKCTHENRRVERSMKLLHTAFPILANEIVILYNNRPLTDDKKGLNSYGLKDGDLVNLQHISAVSGRMSGSGKRNVEGIKQRLMFSLQHNQELSQD